jgi:hypothetical protein
MIAEFATTRESRWGLAVVLMAFAVLALVVLSTLDQNRIDDDAYMFVRYARNILAHGVVAWNPNEAPVYGVTSLAYLAAVTALQVLIRADPAVVLVAATLLFGCAFVAGMAWLVWRYSNAASRAQRTVVLAWVLLGLTWSAGTLSAHCVSGMDTMLALCGLTLLLVFAKRWEARPTVWRSVLWALAAGSTLWLRPDMLPFPFVVLVATVALAPTVEQRRGATTTLALAVVVAAALATIAWLYFGTLVPLPAYAKVLHGYGADMAELYRDTPGQQLTGFVRNYAPFLVVAAAGLVVLVRRRGARGASIELGVALAVLAFVIFQRFFVLMIMGDRQRFYYPAVPAIAFLAARGGILLASTSPVQRIWRRRAWRLIALGVAVASLLPQATRAVAELFRQPRFTHFTVLDNFEHGFPSKMWLGLDRFSALPDDLVIATTEVGYPGVLNPRKTIVDLSGLNDLGFARDGFSAEALFARYRPDLFMIPTRHYAALRHTLLRHPEFRRDYRFFRPEGSLGLGLRRTSRYYDEMLAVLQDSRSSSSVTGPSLTSSTRMWAWNQPASTAAGP